MKAQNDTRHIQIWYGVPTLDFQACTDQVRSVADALRCSMPDSVVTIDDAVRAGMPYLPCARLWA